MIRKSTISVETNDAESENLSEGVVDTVAEESDEEEDDSESDHNEKEDQDDNSESDDKESAIDDPVNFRVIKCLSQARFGPTDLKV